MFLISFVVRNEDFSFLFFGNEMNQDLKSEGIWGRRPQRSQIKCVLETKIMKSEGI